MAALKQDDLEVGMKVTVLKWHPREVPGSGLLGLLTNEGGGVATRTVQDHSWCGDVLVVTAINLPFVVVDELTGSQLKGVDLDLRRLDLMKISEEFIAARMKSLRV